MATDSTVNPGIQNATLLIVDDEPFLRELLSRSLKKFGAKILTAENGQEALDLIKAGGIDAVLTDIDMPVMSGLELLENMRALGFITPVVILTGHGDQATTLTALRLGATDFLDKPFEADLLQQVMNKALDAGAAARVLEEQLKNPVPGDGGISVDQFRSWKAAVTAAVKPKDPKSGK